jgi:hypothetical protein
MILDVLTIFPDRHCDLNWILKRVTENIIHEKSKTNFKFVLFFPREKIEYLSNNPLDLIIIRCITFIINRLTKRLYRESCFTSTESMEHKTNDYNKDSDVTRFEHIRRQLGARRIEFITVAVIGVVFAVCFAHLEYYYIKDPALHISNKEGKSIVITDKSSDRSRETEPIIGNMYQYHLFPMFFIFVLISFAALFDDMTVKMFGKNKRRKALFLGCATLITAIVVEDFAWFVNRWLVPLDTDPKGGQLMQYSDWTSMHIGAIDVGSFVLPYGIYSR